MTTPARKDSLARRAAFLARMSDGNSVMETCRQLGMAYRTYRYWIDNDKEFKGQVHVLRLQQNKNEHKGWQGDFATFRETYFPQQYPSPLFHTDIIKMLEGISGMAIGMVLCPPNAGKSTLMTDWVCYKLATDPNHRITIVSKGQAQARKMLGHIQRRMTDIAAFPEFIGKFGPFYNEGQERQGKPWTRDYFTVAKADHDERDYSLQVLGWTGQIYGSRVDTLILDDIQTRDNLGQVDAMFDKFSLEAVSRLHEDWGKLFYIGTRIEVGDFPEKLIDSGVISSKNMKVVHAINYSGESYWPDRWPVSKLDNDEEDHKGIRQLVGEKAWWCAYQQQPALSAMATFTDQMMDGACDKTRKIGSGTPGESVVLGLDPALGGGNAIIALAYDMEQIRVLDCQRDTGLSQSEEILNLVEQYALRYNPRALIIEINAFQRSLGRDDRLQALGTRYGFRIYEHSTTRNKLDPVMGVASMDSSFIRGEVSIPWGDDMAKNRMLELVQEFRSWRPNVPTRLITQDLVMAFWFAWLHVLTQRRVMGASADGWKKKGMPYPPTHVPMSKVAAV